MLAPTLLLIACTDAAHTGAPDPLQELENPATASLELQPEVLDFGQLRVGEQLTQTLTVRNSGHQELRLRNMTLEPADSPFDLAPVDVIAVQPGESFQATLGFAPLERGRFDAELWLQTNSVQGDLWVPIRGSGTGPELTLSPPDHNFDTPFVGCEDQRQVLVHNTGARPLHISGLELDPPNDDLWVNPRLRLNGPLPWTLAPKEALTVTAHYAPQSAAEHLASFRLVSDDPVTPVSTLTLSGQPTEWPTHQDVFDLSTNDPLDLLLAMDRLGSMANYTDRIDAGLPALLDALDAQRLDYHLAVVIADNGCVGGSQNFIDSSQSRSEQLASLAEMMDQAPGFNAERPFMQLEAALALHNTGQGGCNEGLLREQARLALLPIADEPEQSVNPYSYYVNLFRSLKANSDDVTMHAIAGDYPTGCGGASAGTGMYESTVATGGLFQSICDTDQGPNFEHIVSAHGAPDSRFPLSVQPVPESVTVTLDGQAVAELHGQEQVWSWEASDNAVQFAPGWEPRQANTLEIDYRIALQCGG